MKDYCDTTEIGEMHDLPRRKRRSKVAPLEISGTDGQQSTSTDTDQPIKLRMEIGKKRYLRAMIETNVDFLMLPRRFKMCCGEYLKISTLHGLNYITDKTLTKAER